MSSSDIRKRPDFNFKSLLSGRARHTINDYLDLIEDIHNIMLNCKDLTNIQIVELCERQREHMKSYLRKIVERLFPNRKIDYVES